EPNAILDLRHGTCHDPNARATLEPLVDGIELRSIHADGTAVEHRPAFIDRFARLIPPALFYKTLILPRWKSHQHPIPAMAGLGRIDPTARANAGPAGHAQVDVCLVGSGPSGLAAALAAARLGRRVLLIEQQSELGGSLLHRDVVIDDLPGNEWAKRAEQTLVGRGVTIL